MANNKIVDIESLKAFRERLDDKYVIEGEYSPQTSVGKADIADNLATDLGTNPSYLELTGSEIGAAVDEDSYASVLGVKGNSVVVNQLVPTLSMSATVEITQSHLYQASNWLDNIFSFRIGGTTTFFNQVKGHKCFAKVYIDTIYLALAFGNNSNSILTNTATTSSNSVGIGICEYPSDSNTGVIGLRRTSDYSGNLVAGTYHIKVEFVDLTQFFNGNIPEDLTADSFIAKYGYLIPNTLETGKIVNTQLTSLDFLGLNQWDEEWELGNYDNDGNPISSSANIRNVNSIKVLPNTTYYFKCGTTTNVQVRYVFYDVNMNCISSVAGNTINQTFTTPSNACFMSFGMNTYYGTTYNHDICVNVSNATYNGTYKPFVKHTYPLNMPILRKAGSVADTNLKVNIGYVDLGTLNWVSGGSGLFYVPFTGSTRYCDILSTIYHKNSVDNTGLVENLGVVMRQDYIFLKNETYGVDASAFKTAMSGNLLYYELATPTDQPTISLPENIQAENGGTIFANYDSEENAPSDLSVLYKVNDKAFLEGVGARTDISWNKDNVVSQTQLESAIDTNNTKIKNGQIIAGNSQLADNLTPYSEDSGTEQSNPFISNGTGTNNNQEIVTVGDYGLLRSKNGNTVCVNQLFPIKSTTTISGITYTNNGDGSYTLNGTASSTDGLKIIDNIAGFKVGKTLLMPVITNVEGVQLQCYSADYGGIGNRLVPIFTMPNVQTSDSFFRIRVEGGTTLNNLKVIPQLIDLTQWFNGDIPQDLLDNPEHWSWYQNYGDYIAYNTGTLVNANGVKLVSTGRNQWDEQWEVGGIDNSTGEYETNGDFIRSKNYNRILPNTTYYGRASAEAIRVFFYDKNKNHISNVSVYNTTFTTPSDACWFRLKQYNNTTHTYNHDITISLYYTPQQGGEGYDKYYPYETPYEVNTGSEVLRSAGSVYDYKEPNGTIHRLVGTLVLDGSSDESYTYVSSGNRFAFGVPTFTSPEETIKAELSCDKLQVVTKAQVTAGDFRISGTDGGQHSMYIRLTSDYTTVDQLRTWLSNNPLTIHFPLTTPTTEQGTTFAENLPINDYGMLYWLDSSNNLVGIPQGNTIFFPINYKGFLDDMYSKVEGDSSAYVVDSDLSDYVKQTDLSSGITDVAGLTYDIKRLYKTGNVCNLTIKATNSSGSAISSGTALFALPNSAYGSGSIFGLACLEDGTPTKITIENTGNVKISNNVPNTIALYITISYAIA